MKDLTNILKICILALVLAVGGTYLFAWTGPTATAPGNNTDAPVNAGLNSQSKLGALFLNTSLTNPFPIGLSVFGKSIFNGAIQITGGAPTAGKVLTATDGSGNAAWATSGVSDYTTVTSTTLVSTGTSGDKSIAYCPTGYTRIACSGARNSTVTDTCSEDDCGYIGTIPVDPNGCETGVDTGPGVAPVAVAYCAR